MDKLVSIIIPVYNVGKYLSRCIESIQRQTYTNLQIILVDDGSTDSSSELCDEYEKKDDRIIVIHKENGGLSSARNAGLEICQGEFFSFVDSDDWIDENCIDIMLKAILESKSDIVQCGYRKVDDDKNVIFQSTMENSILNGHKEILDSFFVLQNYNTMACMKLYRSDLLGDVRFYNGRNNEDTIYFADYINQIDRVQIINDILYNYYINCDSIMHSRINKKKVDDAFFSAEYLLKKCLESYPEYICYMRRNICNFSTGLYLQAYQQSEINLMKFINEKFIFNYNVIKKNKNIEKKYLLKFMLFYYFKYLYMIIWRIKKVK